MTTAQVHVSIGDQGALNETLGQDLSAIWIDRNLGGLDFNERVLAYGGLRVAHPQYGASIPRSSAFLVTNGRSVSAVRKAAMMSIDIRFSL